MNEFRSDGSLQSQTVTNFDGSSWTSTYEYDAQGLLLLVQFKNIGGVPATQQRYEYDSQGRIVRLITQSGGREHVAEAYSYDEAGRKMKTIHVDPETQRPDVTMMWGVEGTGVTNYSAPGTATVTTIYDVRAHAEKLLFHDKSGRLLSHVDFRYDEVGNLIEETQFRNEVGIPAELLAGLTPSQQEAVRRLLGGRGEPYTRLKYRYDEQGHRIESLWELTPMSVDRKTLTYNDHGDQIGEIAQYEHRECEMDDEGRLTPGNPTVHWSEVRFHHTYDDRGNWIEKTVEGRRKPDEDFVVWSIERRVITYFA